MTRYVVKPVCFTTDEDDAKLYLVYDNHCPMHNDDNTLTPNYTMLGKRHVNDDLARWFDSFGICKTDWHVMTPTFVKADNILRYILRAHAIG